MGEHKQPTALEAALHEVRRGLAVVAALSLFLNLLVLVSPLYMFQVFDRVLPSGHVETLVALTVAAGFALLVFGLLEVIRHQALVRMSTWLDRRLSEPVLTASVGEALAERPVGGAAAARSRPAARLPQQRERLPGSRRALDAGLHRGDLDAAPVARRAGVPGRGTSARARAGERNRSCGRRSARPTSAGWPPIRAGRRRCATPRWCTPWACCRRCCGAGMPTTIAPSSGMRRRATAAPSWSASPSSCASSSRSRSWGSARTWCCKASSPAAA